MPKNENKIGSNTQTSLFTALGARPGTLNQGGVVRAVAAKVIRDSEYSRDQIAERMSELTGADVTVRMLNDWTAESKAHRFPLEYLAAFCHATADFSLLAAVVETCGARVISEHEGQLLDFGQSALTKEIAEREYALRLARLAKDAQ